MTDYQEILNRYLQRIKEDGISFHKAARMILEDYPFVTKAHRTIRYDLSNTLKRKEKQSGGNTINFEKNYEYKGRRSMTSTEDAIEFFDIDLHREEIVKSQFNAWDVTIKDADGKAVTSTNYQVKLITTPKKISFDYTKALTKLKTEKYTPKVIKGSGAGLLSIADIHTGANTEKSEGLVKTKPFSFNILQEYMSAIVAQANELNREEVRVAILGDLIESFTGLNHLNSWQDMESWMGDAVILAYEIIKEFLSKINNLSKVYIVSGNHDRISSNREGDPIGNVTKLVAFMLKQSGFNVVYHPVVISESFDQIHYIMTHGHHKMVKEVIKMILNYGGDRSEYHVLMYGHFHTRNKKIPVDTRIDNLVLQDSVDYRAIGVAPLFTGNLFSETLGYSSTAGFSWVERAGNAQRNINHFDFGL